MPALLLGRPDPLARQVLLIFGGATLLIVGLLAYGAVVSYREAIDRAEALAVIEARLLADHALRTFERVDLQLERLVEDIERNRSWLTTHQPEVTDHLDQINRGFQFIRSIAIVDADGILINGNATGDYSPLDLSDRDYFRAHADATSVGTFVGRPLIGRASGKVFIGVSRRIDNSDGSFDGVAAAIFEPLYFKGTHELQRDPAHLGEGLLFDDGTILAANLGETGTKLPVPAEALARARESGEVLTRAAIAGMDSIVALRAVSGRPLYTMAVRPLGVALAEWRGFVLGLAAIGGISILALIIVTGVAWRELRARRAAEEARAKALDDLTAANENLARSNRDLQEFAQVASHDLQEPLRKIRYFSLKLKDQGAAALGEAGIDKLARLESATERMQRLINDLLEFARVTTRAQPFSTVELNGVVAEVLSDLEAQILETGATISTVSLATVAADRSQMRQLFQNLIGNAIKYRRADATPNIRIRAERAPATMCRIVVEDNGIGFDQKYVDRIFQPFQRLHGRSAYEGTGMGLAICRRIVERHGGTLTAEGRVDGGARFVVTLPFRQPQQETSSCPTEASPSPYSLPTTIPTTAR